MNDSDDKPKLLKSYLLNELMTDHRQASDEEQKLLRSYLLGELNQQQREEVEERLMMDEDFFKESLLVEDDLIDDYVQGELSADERKKFEATILSTPRGRQQVELSSDLRAYAAAVAKKKPSPDSNVVQIAWWRKPLQSPSFRAAASILIIFGISVAVYRGFIYQPPADRGLALLKEAYKDERPLEARISGFSYAPLVSTTRGGKENQIDNSKKDRAAYLFKTERDEHLDSAEAHYNLGRYYLTEKNFDKAIEEFKTALTQEPDQAQIHSDLGVALLEKGKSFKNDKGMSGIYFAESLEHLDKALALDSNLLSALFNRALLYEQLPIVEKAQEDWKTYLEKERDPNWAKEATDKLKKLEDSKKQTSQNREELFQKFLDAYQSRDDVQAWKAFRLSRARTGNFITEQLIDDYLNLAASEKPDDSKTRLQMLSYAGEVESRKVDDHFTTDLSNFYQNISTRQRQIIAQARKLIRTGNQLFDKSEFDEAAKFFVQARNLFSQTGDICEALFAHNWVGNCYKRMENSEKSFSIFNDLSLDFNKKNYKWLYAQTLNAISDAHSGVNELSKSLDYANQSLKLCEEIEDSAGGLRNLIVFTSINLDLGKYRESLGFSLHGLEIASTFSPSAKQLWPFYQDASLALYSLGFFNAAIEFQKQSVKLAIESKEPLLQAHAYARMCLLYGKRKEYEQAVMYGELAIAEGDKIGSSISKDIILSTSLLNLAHSYRESGEMNRAIENYNKAIELYEKLKLDVYLYDAHKGKLLAYIKLDNEFAANEELQTSLRLFERYRKSILEESNRNSFFDVGQDIYDIAIDFTYSKGHDSKKAFQYAEDSRARSLLDLAYTENRVIIEAAIPDNKLNQVFEPLTLAEIQQQLPKDVSLVQYSILQNKTLIWVISKDSFESKEQNLTIDELSEKVRVYLQLISNASKKHPGEAIQYAKELYDILINPIEALLDENKQIYIIPDKILSHLPYYSLISPNSGKYLIENYFLSTTPSASMFIKCTEAAQQREHIESEQFLGVGNPNFDQKRFSDFPDLPSAREEVKEIASYYDKPTELLEDDAKLSTVKEEMQKANVIHLASHYAVDDYSPMLSKLLLAKSFAGSKSAQEEAGILQSSEIYKMRLSAARLIVLSACQTGVERTYNGEGAISAARPFIAAGVPLVIASLWPVDSQATKELMIKFHQYRKLKGLSTTEALRKAQLEMLTGSEERYHHPYFWASFIVIGGYATF